MQDAFVVALERWPRDGVPANPAAWIALTARRKAIDRLRREKRCRRRRAAASAAEALDAEPENVVTDERLELIFACCHPAIAPESRVALTLRALGGLSTREVARAFLVSEDAMAQRLAARQAQDPRRRHPLRAAAPRGPAGPPRLRARHALPDLHRGLRGDRRRRAGPARAVRRGDPPRARAVRADARRARGARAARADAAARLAARRARRRRRRARPARRTRTARAGTRRRSPRAAGWSSARWRCGGDGPYVLQAFIAVEHSLPDGPHWLRVAGAYDRLLDDPGRPGGRAQPRGRGGDGARPARAGWS